MKHCKYCGGKMKDAHPNKKFCCTKHKDRFHNEHNPRGIYAHLKKSEVLDVKEIEDTEFAFDDPYSLGQE